jgi:hypothetical protein
VRHARRSGLQRREGNLLVVTKVSFLPCWKIKISMDGGLTIFVFDRMSIGEIFVLVMQEVANSLLHCFPSTGRDGVRDSIFNCSCFSTLTI